MKRSIAALALFPVLAPAAVVEITFAVVPDSVTGDAVTIPNPDGGEFVITPSAEISSGEMVVRFSANESGMIQNGSATVTGLDFSGNITLRATTGQQILGQDIFVDLAGLLSSDQQTWSFGSLEGLSTYSEASNGTYDTLFGPVVCSGNLFNAGCFGLATLTGVDFPLPAVPGDDLALALQNGVFLNLNSPGASTASNSFEVPIQAVGDLGAPFPVNLAWTETSRSFTAIPEPHTGLLSVIGSLALMTRRMRK